MRLRDVMTSDIETIPSYASIRQAAERMDALNVGFIPVQENDAVVGIVTDRDITVRAVAHGTDAEATPVCTIMTNDMWCLPEDRDINEAAELMAERQIRRVLVLDRENRMVGVVSIGDLAVQCDDDCRIGDVLERVSEPAQPVRS